MDNQAIMQVFTELGAITLNSHFVFTSGRHSNAYINKDALYVHTQAISKLCKLMADEYDADKVDVVIGPTIGGVVLSQWVTHHLNARRSSGETLSLYAEKEGEGEDKKFVIKRGYNLHIPGKNVVVVEDLLTTGGSARKVIECVRSLKGNVLGLSVLCNRGQVSPQDVGNVPIKTLINFTLNSWTEEECQLCKDNVPINTNLGKGKAFLERRAALPKI